MVPRIIIKIQDALLLIISSIIFLTIISYGASLVAKAQVPSVSRAAQEDYLALPLGCLTIALLARSHFSRNRSTRNEAIIFSIAYGIILAIFNAFAYLIALGVYLNINSPLTFDNFSSFFTAAFSGALFWIDTVLLLPPPFGIICIFAVPAAACYMGFRLANNQHPEQIKIQDSDKWD